MRTLNKDEHNYIKQIANIHETLLSQVESNYKCTKLSIALRYEMICS
ncbi:TPA: GNAT family N-acetyltransferase, partial [Staphylococcus aureus]|nr:GNAT family N-acetyltransferase [Staphylococcus aureus]HCX9779584.1 GNAT family N-acetyltransferase [Staphylococcus aureus]